MSEALIRWIPNRCATIQKLDTSSSSGADVEPMTRLPPQHAARNSKYHEALLQASEAYDGRPVYH